MFNKTIKRRVLNEIPDDLKSLPELTQRLYACRGIRSSKEVNTNLSALHDYRLLDGVEDAARMLADVINEQQSVMIVGDFDADGATSTALLMLALPKFGLKNLNYIVPNRFEFGYGLSVGIVEEIAKHQPDWIITVDNGISNIDGVALARELGINVLITDHHLAPEQLPNANHILNPNKPGDGFPSKAMAGVGVAFYLLIALRAELRQRNAFADGQEPNLGDWLDLVALGTVADVVPLDQNNRILVAQGLARIRAGECRPAIKMLLEVAKRKQRQVTASDLGFAVGPRLNAAGRLEDMSIGIEALITGNEEAARRLVLELDDLNRYRREREKEMVDEAQQAISHLNLEQQQRQNGYCLFHQDWHQGIVGLVASRIKEKLHRPVIAFAPEDELFLKGSGRSVEGVHLRDVLANVAARRPDLLQKFGGHAMAAGLSIARRHLAEFTKVFIEEVDRWLLDSSIREELLTDGELDDRQFSIEVNAEIERAGPWGQGFPEPLFDGKFDVLSQRIVGEKHLKLYLQKHNSAVTVDGIYFFAPEEILHQPLDKVELAYKLNANEFREQVNLQLIIEQLTPLTNIES